MDIQIKEPDFYEELEKGNAIMHQQAKNNIVLAITSRLTESILSGEDVAKAETLMALMNKINNDSIR